MAVMPALTAAMLLVAVGATQAAMGGGGTPGDDRLFGTAHADRIDGGGGRDEIVGEQGADWLIGGFGADDVYGADGDDLLSGGPGDDLLVGNLGRDRIWAGSGADFVDVRSGESDTVHCGAGVDTVRSDPLDLISADCELHSFVEVTPTAGGRTRRRAVRFTTLHRTDSESGGQHVVELRGPRGRCARLDALLGPDDTDPGEVVTVRFGVRLKDNPDALRYRVTRQGRRINRLCRGRYRAEIKFQAFGEGGQVFRSRRVIERTYFDVT